MQLEREKLIRFYWNKLPKFAPKTHKFGFDFLYLIFILLIQTTLVISLPKPLSVIDLVTPWLLVIMIVAPLGRAFFLVLFAGVYLEMHSALPLGFYVSAFYFILSLITILKKNISWRNEFVWVCLFVFSQLSIEFYKLLLASAKLGSWNKLTDMAFMALALVVAVTFSFFWGMWLRSKNLDVIEVTLNA